MRSVMEFERLSELEVGRTLGRLLKDYSVEEVVQATRLDTLAKLPGVGKSKANLMTELIDEMGLIFHESRRSAAMRALLTRLGMLPDIRRTRYYEAQQEFSLAQIEAFIQTIENLLEPELSSILVAYYGLEDVALSIRECGLTIKQSSEMARRKINKALARLSEPKNIARLQKVIDDYAAAAPY